MHPRTTPPKNLGRPALILAVLALLAGSVLPSRAPQAAGQAVSHPEIFGSHEVRSDAGLSMFPRWSGMLTRYAKEKAAAALPCGSSTRQACGLQRWLRSLEDLRDMDKRAQIREVNRRLNARPYVHDDVRLWGVGNYWETPGEFLDRSGDCKDYAIAKFMALREIGFSNEDLRVVVLHDANLRADHAVLVVYLDAQALVLDNLARDIVPAASIRHYRPYYSINETTWWLHVPASGSASPPAPASKPDLVSQRPADPPVRLADNRK